MQRSFVRRNLLFLAAAAISAVASDWTIEGAASLGFYGPAYAEHDQRSIVCTATAAALLFMAYAIATIYERFQKFNRDPASRDWVAEAAHEIASRPWSCRTLCQSFVAAIVIRYAMEVARACQQTGHPPTGVAWLGGPVAIALAVHFCFSAAAFFGLLATMSAIDRTIDHFIQFVLALIAAIGRALAKPLLSFERGGSRFVGRLSLLARHLGERAPPIGVRAALL